MSSLGQEKVDAPRGGVYLGGGLVHEGVEQGSGGVSAVIGTLYRSVVVKSELSVKVVLSIYWSQSTLLPSPVVATSG